MAKKIGMAVVGTKGMGRGHLKAITQVKSLELRGACDVVPAEAEAAAKEFNVPGYTDLKAMLKADPAIKAVAIATPHWFHPAIAIDCAKAGVHVLTEKPMSVTAGDADKMINAHKKAKTVLAVVYQHRFNPVNAAAQQLIASGKLGEIHRVLLHDAGYRTNAYYKSGAWRATWKGEGGGVLLNQAPHSLDLLQWIGGVMPNEIYAVHESFLHPIEVEDRATAILRFKNGAVGTIYASTTDVPGRNYMEFCGDKGLVRIEGGELKYARLKQPLSKFNRTTKAAWSRPDVEWVEVKIKPAKLQGHVAVFDDFAQAISKKRKPRVTGEDGRNSVELANAMILSAKTGLPVKLPVSRKAYDKLMQGLIAKSKKNI